MATEWGHITGLVWYLTRDNLTLGATGIGALLPGTLDGDNDTNLLGYLAFDLLRK
jgi:hypothetical protein